jgi:hypothetical protein
MFMVDFSFSDVICGGAFRDSIVAHRKGKSKQPVFELILPLVGSVERESQKLRIKTDPEPFVFLIIPPQR